MGRLFCLASPGTATPFKLFTAAAGTGGIFAQISLQTDLADRLDHPVLIKPAVRTLDELADLIHHMLLAVIQIVRFKLHDAFCILGPAFLGIDDFQALPNHFFSGKIDQFRPHRGIPGSLQIAGIMHGVSGKARAHQSFGGCRFFFAGMERAATLRVFDARAAKA
jgi:hypothetical protein